MRLTMLSDYSLRILLYLATSPDKTCSVNEIATAFGISQNHLVKVGRKLIRLGLVRAIRGRTGGFQLVRAPAEITVGQVLRGTEPDFKLAECFTPNESSCALTGTCSLQGALLAAEQAFLQTLDHYSIEALVRDEPTRHSLLKLHVSAA